MKKIITILFLTISVFGYSQHLEWIPFNWIGDSVGNKYFDKLAMTIPVTIDDLPHKFNMQLDLGAGTTNFYGNKIKPYLEKYPSLKAKIDPTIRNPFGDKYYDMFTNIDLHLGDVTFDNIHVLHYDKYGSEIPEDSIYTETEKQIGTIAPDLFRNKILIIDYKQQRLAVTETLPVEYSDAAFVKYETKHVRIKIPLNINGKEELLMFDTGSSIFQLTTTKENALKIGSPEIVETLTVNSWGDKITFYGLKTVVPIYFGTKELKNSIVYYDDKGSFDDFYETENMWGLTGNAYFFDNIVIINYKELLFGVK